MCSTNPVRTRHTLHRRGPMHMKRAGEKPRSSACTPPTPFPRRDSALPHPGVNVQPSPLPLCLVLRDTGCSCDAFGKYLRMREKTPPFLPPLTPTYPQFSNWPVASMTAKLGTSPSPTIPSFPLHNPILYLGIPCALVKLMEGNLSMREQNKRSRCGVSIGCFCVQHEVLTASRGAVTAERADRGEGG